MCEPAGNALAVHGAHPHGGPSPPTVELSAMPAQCSYCQKQSAEGEAAAASEEVVEPVSGDRRQADGMGVRTRGLARGVERAQEGGDERDGPRKEKGRGERACPALSTRSVPGRDGTGRGPDGTPSTANSLRKTSARPSRSAGPHGGAGRRPGSRTWAARSARRAGGHTSRTRTRTASTAGRATGASRETPPTDPADRGGRDVPGDLQAVGEAADDEVEPELSIGSAETYLETVICTDPDGFPPSSAKVAVLPARRMSRRRVLSGNLELIPVYSSMLGCLLTYWPAYLPLILIILR
ncbi:unnamed protein product [Diplocarpon coronariae]|nr:hypothetical protein JHW43_004577 [Diplocarpon mali]